MHYIPDFLSPATATALLRWLAGLPWRDERFSMFGRSVTAPRSLIWFGDAGLNYRYSGVDHPSCGWPDGLRDVRALVDEAAGQRFNFVLGNRYADGDQHMGWHRDDEQAGPSLIASLSLGATRRFRLGQGNAARSLDLEDGSLLLFDGRERHCLPRTRRAVTPRINLTFRQLHE